MKKLLCLIGCHDWQFLGRTTLVKPASVYECSRCSACTIVRLDNDPFPAEDMRKIPPLPIERRGL